MARLSAEEKKKIDEEVKAAKDNKKNKAEIEKKAYEFIAGKFGTEEIDIKEALAKDGFSYDEISSVAHAILAGEYFK